MIPYSYHVLGLGLFSALLLTETVSAQTITPDGTINTVVNTSRRNQFAITGGTIQGNNLFHSFDTFSPQDWATLFDLTDSSYGSSTAAISRIISRVTGNNSSSIDGLLQVSGGNFPDLFLINPNGIIFGPNARLNVPGSFIVSTADSIEFSDGITFAANDPTVNPLLTITAPIGLNLPANPNPIEVRGNGHNLNLFAGNEIFGPTAPAVETTGLMTTVPGQTLGLLGGELTLTGGTVTATDGRVELGSIGGGRPTQVGLSPNLAGWQFDYSGVENFDDIALSQQAVAYASGITTPGSMQLVGRQINLTDGSMAILQSLGAVPGGRLQVTTSEGVNVVGTSPMQLRSQIRTEALGLERGADLSIVAPRLQVQEGGRVETATFVGSDSGDLTLQAADAVEVIGFSLDVPETFSLLSSTTLGSGSAGDLTIDTVKLSARWGGFVSVATLFETGDSGNLVINATERVEVVGGSISANSVSAGDTSLVTINTRRLVVQEGGLVGSQAFDSGSGSSVIIRASESIEVAGSNPVLGESQIGATILVVPAVVDIFRLPSEPTGQAGSVDISTPRLMVRERGLVSVQNEGTGDSGNLQIAADTLLLDSSGSITASTASGEGGNIRLQVQDLLLLQNASLISVEARGMGNGGNLVIDASGIVGLDNSDIVANAVFGNGGSIQIATQAIFGLEFQEELTPASDITASSQFGVSGTVNITELEVDPRAEATELTTEFVNLSTIIVHGCGAQIQGNEFIMTGRGGIPPIPTALLAPDRTWQDVRDPAAYMDVLPATTPIAMATEETPLVEIDSWQLTPEGQVELIAVDPIPTVGAPFSNCTVSSQARSGSTPLGSWDYYSGERSH
ncbi:MAG: filamentous hemagglutinin N-terminal domain-containing protein [Cyanothece sp. SIO2G6]|nr:filamentous hemagglutinin N-terminal domain-containing protein [Cyanothece sp. SIO2G6]